MKLFLLCDTNYYFDEVVFYIFLLSPQLSTILSNIHLILVKVDIWGRVQEHFLRSLFEVKHTPSVSLVKKLVHLAILQYLD
jgi:hypothetical protein